ncbi:glycerol-3-phosphate 1-O-acyltransferase PlsY [Candidatus Fermentibacteria bacterium]|nr:glycerol-3-phosphate 1-O-acyltransferase PlsY [Candidatus Fermentibacteria bacterium]
MSTAAALLIAFVLGSIPFSWILGRWAGSDLRKVGSGNVGATNLLRECGIPLGLAGLFLDISKGAGAVLLAGLLGSTVLVESISAVLSVAGHVFTPWLGFRGGKGVATALGSLVVLTPVPVLTALGVFAVTLAVFRIVSLSSVLAALALVPSVFLLQTGPGMVPVRVVCCVVAAVVVARHRSNIVRLLKREEHKLESGADS